MRRGLREDLKLQRPFLSANDRSRWLTIRSLVERGTYEIDGLIGEPTWDTIDMVQHRGRDGELHLYSSKPPLLATLMAGEYWLINRFSGATLRDNPYEIGRIMLITFNILPLVLMYVLDRSTCRAIWHDRLGPHICRRVGNSGDVSQYFCDRAQQPRDRCRKCGRDDLFVCTNHIRRRDGDGDTSS